MRQKVIFYGAKSLALGIYKAFQLQYPEYEYCGFVVKSKKNNPETLAGLKVWELDYLCRTLTNDEKKNVQIIIATPEDLHKEIEQSLIGYGFDRIICMDSEKEAKIMEPYFAKKKLCLLHNMRKGRDKAHLSVLVAKCCKDKPLNNSYHFPAWTQTIQVGAALTETRIAKQTDDTGENISLKNGNYCELTALYWMWKQADLNQNYAGLFHYRRVLDITEDDLYRIAENDLDVILPFPTFHEPDITEHHKRYVNESDWEAMQQAVSELYPEYAAFFPKVFRQEYLYNYNMLIAKKSVLDDYCSWLFPILERTEEISIPKGCSRSDRYIGYLGENLLTLYFMFHKNELKIAHTGRLMLT